MKKCWHKQRSRNLVNTFSIYLTLPSYFLCSFYVSSTKDFTYERVGCFSCCKPRKGPAWKGLRKQNQSKQILNKFEDLTRLQKKVFCVKLKSWFCCFNFRRCYDVLFKVSLIINIADLNVTYLESLARGNRLLITQHWK